MNYDNMTNALRDWCDSRSRMDQQAYRRERAEKGQSLRFFRYLVADELRYKLGTLIGRDFPDPAAHAAAVRSLMAIRLDAVLKRPMGEEEAAHVRAVEADFLAFLDSLSPDCPAPEGPYCRVIWGDEADEILYRLLEGWHYDAGRYWYPLTGARDEGKLFLSFDRVEPHMDEIRRLLDLPRQHIYECGESMFGIPHCAEVDTLEEYGGCEAAYCPRDFSWIIYFSHENTVTFAGSILPGIQQILQAEKESWNRMEWE